MSDSFDVSARVWSVMVDGAEVCRIFAVNGLSVVYRDADRAFAISDKAGIADFIRQVLEAHPVGAVDVIKAVADAIWFAFSEPPPVKREAKPKDELRDWLQATLVHSDGSVVYSKDLRTAWHEYFRATHKTGAYLTPHKFHARLRELGYTVDRITAGRGTGTHVMGVFMRKDRPRVLQGKASSAVN